MSDPVARLCVAAEAVYGHWIHGRAAQMPDAITDLKRAVNAVRQAEPVAGQDIRADDAGYSRERGG